MVLSFGYRRVTTDRHDIVFALGLGGACVVAGALTSFQLGRRSIVFDEAATVAYARLNFPELLHAIQLSDVFFGLYYAIMHLWLRFGDSETVLRSSSVISAVAAVAAIGLLTRRLAGRRAAIVAAVLAAASVPLFELGQQARPYALLVFLSTISTWAFVTIDERPSAARWVRYAVICTIGCYVHLFQFTVVMAHACWAALYRRTLWNRSLLYTVAGIAIALLPLLWILHGYPAVNAYIKRPNLHLLIDTWYWFAGSRPMAVLAVVLVIPVVLRARNQSRPARERIALLALWLLGPPLFIFAVSFGKPMYTERYLIEAWPAYPIALGMLLARYPPPAAIGATVGLAALGIGTIFISKTSVLQDWRSGSEVVLREATPGDALVVYPDRGTIPYGYYRLRFHSGGPTRIYPAHIPFPLVQNTGDATFWEKPSRLPAASARSRRIWFLAGWNDDARTERGIRALVATLPRGYRLTRREHFTHETVLRFDRMSPRQGMISPTEHGAWFRSTARL
jgi:mannosyltransferase